MPQCKAPQLYSIDTYFCLLPEGHDGPHMNRDVPDATEQVWDDPRAEEVEDELRFASEWKGASSHREARLEEIREHMNDLQGYVAEKDWRRYARFLLTEVDRLKAKLEGEDD